MLYKNISRADIILYDDMGKKHLAVSGSVVDSNKFSFVKNSSDFVQVGASRGNQDDVDIISSLRQTLDDFRLILDNHEKEINSLKSKHFDNRNMILSLEGRIEAIKEANVEIENKTDDTPFVTRAPRGRKSKNVVQKLHEQDDNTVQ